MFSNWLNFFTNWLHINPHFHRTLLITNDNFSQENIHHFVGEFLSNLKKKLHFTELLLVRNI